VNVTHGWEFGVAMFLSGWMLRIWAQRHLQYRVRGARMAMTVCGPYAYVRNPIYIAITLMVVGAVMASDDLSLVPLALAWCVVTYSLVVRHEEGRLVAQYGAAYRAYQTHVHRWIPLLPRQEASCPHRSLVQPFLAEAHTPLILAPAVLKSILILFMV
jgi:protein-S-isoprenylcysteine O-methyltransferase Ste14